MPTLNPDKTVVINCEGRDWTLYFGMGALRSFEIETGKGIEEAIGSSVSLNTMCILIKQGLKTAHPDISMEQVDSLFDNYGIQELSEKALEAVQKAFPNLVGNGKTPL